MNQLNTLVQQSLVSHIAAWARIPVSATENSPISYSNGAGLSLNQRLSAFASEVRQHEANLLEPLGVSQEFLDAFLRKSDQYRLLFLQLPLDWMKYDGSITGLVLRDMEGLGTSLRRLEKVIAKSVGEGLNEEDDGPLTIGREVTHLRRFLASRSSFAEEIQGLAESEPVQAIQVFYEEKMRVLRGFDPLMTSLEVYYRRRPSYRPSAIA